jgi:hypothetical protein
MVVASPWRPAAINREGTKRPACGWGRPDGSPSGQPQEIDMPNQGGNRDQQGKQGQQQQQHQPGQRDETRKAAPDQHEQEKRGQQNDRGDKR